MRWLGREENGQPKSLVTDFLSIKLVYLRYQPRLLIMNTPLGSELNLYAYDRIFERKTNTLEFQ